MSEPQPRPRHTTMAGALVVGGSVGVVLTVAEQLSGLYSLETREQVGRFLSEPPGSDLSISVPTALSTLRVVLMVLAGLATTAGVLGFHALRGSTRARLGLSVLAVPIFLGGAAVGGFLTSLVAAGTALLWAGPSGMWFRGEPIPERPAASGSAPGPSFGQPRSLPVRRPETGPGATLQAERTEAPPSGPPLPGRPPASRRPDAVVWACILTWAFSAIALVVMTASAALMAGDPGLVLDEMERQGQDLGGTSVATLTETVYASAAVVAAWSLLAVVLAVQAWRGVGWGRTGVLASAAVVGVVCLLGAAYSLLMLVPAAAALATVVLLNRPDVRAWYAARGPSA